MKPFVNQASGIRILNPGVTRRRVLVVPERQNGGTGAFVFFGEPITHADQGFCVPTCVLIVAHINDQNRVQSDAVFAPEAA